MVNIFIANLDWEITSDDLMSTFSSFGTVTYAHVVYDKATKKSKGFGYIEIENSDHAINAIEALNGVEVNGRKIDVKIASPKANRPARKPKAEKKPFEKKPFGNKPGGNRPGGNRSGGDHRGPNKNYSKPNHSK